MSLERYLLDIPFDRNAGPVNPKHLGSILEVTNCQRAIQEFYFRSFNIGLEPELVLSTSLLRDGQFVVELDQEVEKFFTKLQLGDLVYAERLRDKDSCFVLRDRPSFFDKHSWAKSLHLGVYLGYPDNKLRKIFPCLKHWDEDKGIIYHANGILKKSSLWTPGKFKWYYLPIAAKRII